MRKLSLLLSLALCLVLAVPTFAATDEAVAAADKLYKLGLFMGVGTEEDGTPIYDLDRTPNRAEAITLMVRLLGKEPEALARGWYIPFTDVPEWAHDYVGYAYGNSLTNGISSSEFGSDTAVSTAQYLTFVLRALGYSDGTDFQWDSAWTLTDRLGITSGEYNAASVFTRGDAVIVSANALEVTLKNSNQTLLEVIEDNAQYEPIATSNAGESFSSTVAVYIGGGEESATATVQIISEREAVFTLDCSFAVSEANNYVVSFVKRTGRPLVGTRHFFTFSYYRPNHEFEASGVFYEDNWETFSFNTREEDMSGAVFSDTGVAGTQVSFRVTLPDGCPFSFDMVGEYEMQSEIGTFLGGGGE